MTLFWFGACAGTAGLAAGTVLALWWYLDHAKGGWDL